MPNQLPEQLTAYKNAAPRRARLLDLAGAVLRVLEAAQPAPVAAPLETAAAAAPQETGVPLLAGLAVAAPAFRAVLARLLEVFQHYDLLPPLPPDLAAELLDLPPGAWLQEEGPVAALGRAHRLSAGLLLFIGQQALSPFYQQAAAPHAPRWAQGRWLQPACPACGGPPTLALISPETGQRRLHCRLCNVTWPAPDRQACVFCGAAAAQTTYYFLEDDPARRADLCQACGRYLRTIVLAQLPHPLSLPLEEFVLVDLDTLMAQRV